MNLSTLIRRFSNIP